MSPKKPFGREYIGTKDNSQGNPYKDLSLRGEWRPRIQYRPRIDKRALERREATPPIAERIATILGGIYGGGDSRNSRKKYAHREVYAIVGTRCSNRAITFTDEDCQGLEMPHDDPIITVPQIARFSIELMLVDTGSSVYIIYLSTFDKLYLLISTIQSMRTPLIGFTGHS
ncbi:hypothetical protein LIER_35866 [Lithospermum erythrorhizon]|uniref:Peptidase A1 domain-containing protein n=1 Tax=Lithospermum erythrorhizon TaxID=34254 RepID=A0AAV3NXR6_LITER